MDKSTLKSRFLTNFTDLGSFKACRLAKEPISTFAASCYEWRRRGATKDGVYRIKPVLSQPAFEVYCDMTSYGGGWTLVSRISAYDHDHHDEDGYNREDMKDANTTAPARSAKLSDEQLDALGGRGATRPAAPAGPRPPHATPPCRPQTKPHPPARNASSLLRSAPGLLS